MEKFNGFEVLKVNSPKTEYKKRRRGKKTRENSSGSTSPNSVPISTCSSIESIQEDFIYPRRQRRYKKQYKNDSQDLQDSQDSQDLQDSIKDEFDYDPKIKRLVTMRWSMLLKDIEKQRENFLNKKNAEHNRLYNQWIEMQKKAIHERMMHDYHQKIKEHEQQEQENIIMKEVRERAKIEYRKILDERAMQERHNKIIEQINATGDYYAINGFIPSIDLYNNYMKLLYEKNIIVDEKSNKVIDLEFLNV